MLFMGVNLFSFAAFTSASSAMGSPAKDTDELVVTLPADTEGVYSLHAVALLENFRDPVPSDNAGCYSRVSSILGGSVAEAAANMYDTYNESSRRDTLYCPYHAHQVTLKSYATTTGNIATANTSASFVW